MIPTAADAAVQRVARFGATERHLHTIHASAFVVMFLTGLVLYVPTLAQVFSDRPLVKGIHLVAAAAWLTALALVAVLGDRRALRRTRREIEHFDADDLRWLRRREPSPQGRFNAGQKAHAIVQAGLALLFTISGALLWLGERNNDLRLPGTLALHDWSMILAGVLVAGHVWIALSPDKLPALRGILRGTVPAGYASTHHPKWDAPPAGTQQRAARPGALRLATATVVVMLGLLVGAAFTGLAFT